MIFYHFFYNIKKSNRLPNFLYLLPASIVYKNYYFLFYPNDGCILSNLSKSHSLYYVKQLSKKTVKDYPNYYIILSL